MIVSRARGFIFVHIPKTGGTALAQTLEVGAPESDLLIGDTPEARRRKPRLRGLRAAGRLWKHARLADLPGLVGEEELRGMFVFTLVRNPWDRAVSYYHWLRGQRFAHPAVALAQRVGFAEFLAHPQTRAAFRAAPYGAHVRLPSGEERCDAFVRLERFAADIAPVERHLGVSLRLPERVNASQRARDWRSYYDARTAALVAEDCADDIARFGYAFDA
ncbi:MAG: sulfotransferase family 2 domain-containing protein [Paracoccaceae bacterium]|jgi:hypothetical protein|nr:sulfotransferase family 2 domain-containing protein [Paracoccaceae bacterium]